MNKIDIIITDNSLIKKILEKLDSLDVEFRWSDGDELFKGYESIKDKLENSSVFFTVSEDGIVEYDDIEYRDESSPSITDYDFLNSDDIYIQRNYDPVNLPSHYADTMYQPVDVIDDWGLDFYLGNALKYIKRAGHKKSGTLSDKEKEIQDLEKAVWYINHKIQLLYSE